MRRADRLFALVQLLRNRRFATAQELAGELGVAPRTVYRDVQDLSRSGVPIVGEAGVGYRLDAKHTLPPLTFNTEELSALVLGMRMVQAWADPELALAAQSTLRKVEAVVPETMARALLETPLFAPDTCRAKTSRRELSRIRRAIDQRRKVALDYIRADGTASERTVRPLGLYFFGDRRCLAAWCELREDYRVFRPDRVVQLEMTEERFDDSDGVSLAAFLEQISRRRQSPT